MPARLRGFVRQQLLDRRVVHALGDRPVGRRRRGVAARADGRASAVLLPVSACLGAIRRLFRIRLAPAERRVLRRRGGGVRAGRAAYRQRRGGGVRLRCGDAGAVLVLPVAKRAQLRIVSVAGVDVAVRHPDAARALARAAGQGSLAAIRRDRRIGADRQSHPRLSAAAVRRLAAVRPVHGEKRPPARGGDRGRAGRARAQHRLLPRVDSGHASGSGPALVPQRCPVLRRAAGQGAQGRIHAAADPGRARDRARSRAAPPRTSAGRRRPARRALGDAAVHFRSAQRRGLRHHGVGAGGAFVLRPQHADDGAVSLAAVRTRLRRGRADVFAAQRGLGRARAARLRARPAARPLAAAQRGMARFGRVHPRHPGLRRPGAADRIPASFRPTDAGDVCARRRIFLPPICAAADAHARISAGRVRRRRPRIGVADLARRTHAQRRGRRLPGARLGRARCR